jgi:predicted NAD/FAD-binding protein
MDIATAVFGKFSYKNLFNLFRKLDIDTVRAFKMNPFNVSCPSLSYYNLDTEHGMFFTPGFKGLLAQHFEILRPDRVLSVLRLMHGLKRAQTASRRGDLLGLTIEEALRKIPQLRGDAKLMFIGCLCLATSMHCNEVLEAPADFIFEKLNVYNDVILPTPRSLRSVSLVKKGTKSYIDALSAPYQDRIMLNANIRTVTREDAGIRVRMEDGRDLSFDKVVFACNADQALQLLHEPTHQEQRVLAAWNYTEARIVVHSDHTRFPKRELMEGFTFLYQDRGRYIETSVSGSLWALPNVSKKSDLISTQHPNFPIANDRIVFEKVFRTPLFDFKSCSTIRELPSLNGVKNTYYCGSHFGFGLHEDAVTSAIDVARKLDVHF